MKINVKKSPSSLEDLKIKQSKLALKDNKQYVLYFDAYANEDKTIKAMINGKAFDANSLLKVRKLSNLNLTQKMLKTVEI